MDEKEIPVCLSYLDSQAQANLREEKSKENGPKTNISSYKYS